MSVGCPQGARGEHQSPGAAVRDGCEPPESGLGTNLGLLQEQGVLTFN